MPAAETELALHAATRAPLKVCLLEAYGKGGIHACTFNLCTDLARLGIDVTLVTSRDATEAVATAAFPIERRLGGMRPGLPRPLRVLDYFQSLLQLDPWLRASHFDLLHLHESLVPFLDAPALSLLKGRGIPLVYTVHDPDQDAIVTKGDKGGLRKPFLARIYRTADHLISLSETGTRALVDDFGISPGKISRIPLGNFIENAGPAITREQARAALGIPYDKKVILFFGAIKPTKGLPDLLKAFDRIRQSITDAYLVVAGEPRRASQEQEYREALAQLERQNMARAKLEYISPDELPGYFIAADVVALPYLQVYQSAVVQLAYAFGRPVVGTSVGGLAEVIEDGQTGLSVPPANPSALAAALIQILSDDIRREEMGRRAHQAAVLKYSWENIARETYAVYERVLTGRRTSIAVAVS